ncbi:MAG: YceI family protein [Pseudomonadota bacterium]
MTRTALMTASAALVILAACGGGEPSADATPAPHEHGSAAGEKEASAPVLPESLSEVSSGAYSLERNHAFLEFGVGHSGGISDYIVHFGDFDADLSFNAEDPAASSLSVTINPLDLIVNYPGDYKAGHADSGYETWAEDMARNPRWLNADAFPEITFTSTAVEITGDSEGTVTGDLNFLGVTQPVTLDVSYNGNANTPWFGERDLIGFNAETTINRSDFGMSAAIPNISDAVTISFSGEFLQDEAAE